MIRAPGNPSFPEADITIFGMLQTDMNALSALSALANPSTGISPNTVQLDANSGQGWSTVYFGQIISAQIDYDSAPDVSFKISSRNLVFESIQQATPLSYTGATNVADVVETLATKMGRNFVNHGVTTVASRPYLAGTLTQQLKKICGDYGVSLYIDPASNTLNIAPSGQPIDTPTFTLTPQNGLVGYPKIDSRGYVVARCLFNPALRFGGTVTISGSDVVIDPTLPKSFNSRADGTWICSSLAHTLEAVKFNGAWFSEMLLIPQGALVANP